MANNRSKFDLWWNSYPVRRIFSAVYSFGAAIVILGALFKIIHLPYANEMLMVGMLTEVVIFALGIFDKPLKEFDWNNIFDFSETGEKLSANLLQRSSPSVPQHQGLNLKSASLLESDIEKLSEGVRNLTTTARQLTDLTSVVDVTDKFVKNIETASTATHKYSQSQDSLNVEVEKLHASYAGISSGMDIVERNTKQYSSKIEDINKNLSSINSIYEIQLKNIHVQSESLTSQSEAMRKVTDEVNTVLGELKKIKSATVTAVEETENFKTSTTSLSRQIGDLNRIYGNMLNALS